MQSSLVPAAALPSQPNPDPLVDAYLGDATVTFLSRPRRAPDDDSGLWVTRHLLQGALTVHPSPLFGFRLTGFAGLHAGAFRAAPTSLPNPGRDVRGFGSGAVMSLPFGRHGLVITADFSFVQVPSRIFAECTSGCEDEPDMVDGDRRDTTLIGSSTFGYAYRFEDTLRAQVTLGLQNHPTNREAFTSHSADSEINTGPLYVTAGLGLEWAPLPWLGVAPVVQWPLTRAPIEYGPIVGLGFRGMLPRSMLDP